MTLLFGSGKTIITGGTHPGDAKETINYVYGQLDDLGLLDEE